MAVQKKVTVIEVWEDNLDEQFRLINSLVGQFPYVSMDTAFPGTLLPQPRLHPYPPLSRLSAARETYFYMMINVNQTKLIQLGLTLSDASGKLPQVNNSCCIWEFNFRDFDIDVDNQNENSILLLKDQGINFEKNKVKGIDLIRFARLFRESRLTGDYYWTPQGCIQVQKLTWVTFHSPYDFGHLIKVLNQRDLPDDLFEFMELVKEYFGVSVYDVEHIAKSCKLFGGLEKIAKTLDVDRVAGKHHQAGSDSLFTMQTFMKLEKTYLQRIQMDWFRLKLSGLEIM